MVYSSTLADYKIKVTTSYKLGFTRLANWQITVHLPKKVHPGGLKMTSGPPKPWVFSNFALYEDCSISGDFKDTRINPNDRGKIIETWPFLSNW